MEIQPEFNTQEVARTVALAVSNLQTRSNTTSDSCDDETPLVNDKFPTNNTTVNASPDLKKEISLQRGFFQALQEKIPARYVLTMMGFWGFFNVYALRVNLSVALVAMVNSTINQSTSDECQVINNETSETMTQDGEFYWTPTTQANILGSFFYGYVLTQVPGGRMAEKFGGKWLFGIGVLCTAMHCMIGRWMPKYERSMTSTIIYSGAQIGTVFAMPISGLLCSSTFLGGWPSVFYVFGFLGCLWFVFWTLLVHEKPEQHPRISKSELTLIQSQAVYDNGKNQPPIPWREILTSVPVWALIITHFGQNWGFYTLLTELPTYFNRILHFDIKTNGYLSALPYLLQAICSWIAGFVADGIRRRNSCKISVIRKVFNSIGFFGSAIGFLGVILAGCDYFWAVFSLSIAMGFNGAISSGYMVTHVDMSPVFAGTLMGLTNGFANLAGILAPLAVGALTEHQQTLHQWQIVFYISMATFTATGLLFIFCGSARLQPWGSSQIKGTDHNAKDKDSDLNE